MPAVSVVEKLLLLILLIWETQLDIRKKEISVLPVVLFGLAGVILRFADEGLMIYPDMISGALIGIVILALSVLTKGAVGTGDGLLLVTSGIYLGFEENLGLFFSGLILCAIVGLFLLLVLKADRKKKIPFVPFLLAAFAVINLAALGQQLG